MDRHVSRADQNNFQAAVCHFTQSAAASLQATFDWGSSINYVQNAAMLHIFSAWSSAGLECKPSSDPSAH